MDIEEITDSIAFRQLSNLRKKTIDYKESLTQYCLRYIALNAINSIRSEEAYNQISDYLDSYTYQTYYIDQQIGIDIIAIVKGYQYKDNIIRDVNSIGKSVDTNALYELSIEDQEAIKNLLEIVEAKIAL